MQWNTKDPTDDYRWWFAWYPITGKDKNGNWRKVWLEWVEVKTITSYPTGEWHTYTKQNFYRLKKDKIYDQ